MRTLVRQTLVICALAPAQTLQTSVVTVCRAPKTLATLLAENALSLLRTALFLLGRMVFAV
jgi:hypothetical protein